MLATMARRSVYVMRDISSLNALRISASPRSPMILQHVIIFVRRIEPPTVSDLLLREVRDLRGTPVGFTCLAECSKHAGCRSPSFLRTDHNCTEGPGKESTNSCHSCYTTAGIDSRRSNKVYLEHFPFQKSGYRDVGRDNAEHSSIRRKDRMLPGLICYPCLENRHDETQQPKDNGNDNANERCDHDISGPTAPLCPFL